MRRRPKTRKEVTARSPSPGPVHPVNERRSAVLRILVPLTTAMSTLTTWVADRLVTEAGAGSDRGQTTAEYALVLVGVAAIALLIVAWATDSNKIGQLLDSVLDSILDKVR
jgi:Flp pilus assembly pilin Flp